MRSHTDRNPNSRRLPDGVRVVTDTPLDELWDQFHVFEALHHQLEIMNPMSTGELAEVVDAIELKDHDQVLDLGCGHGELLMRLARSHQIRGVGVDASPWQIARAYRRASSEELLGSLEWWLGSAESVAVESAWDLVSCLGASWIWGGFEGTIEALVGYARAGGWIAVGDLQRREEVPPNEVPEDYGQVLSAVEQTATLERAGIAPVTQVVGSVDSWIGYDQLIAASAERYASSNPGPEAEGFMDQQRNWTDTHRDDHRMLAFTVWVGRVL